MYVLCRDEILWGHWAISALTNKKKKKRLWFWLQLSQCFFLCDHHAEIYSSAVNRSKHQMTVGNITQECSRDIHILPFMFQMIAYIPILHTFVPFKGFCLLVKPVSVWPSCIFSVLWPLTFWLTPVLRQLYLQCLRLFRFANGRPQHNFMGLSNFFGSHMVKFTKSLRKQLEQLKPVLSLCVKKYSTER